MPQCLNNYFKLDWYISLPVQKLTVN